MTKKKTIGIIGAGVMGSTICSSIKKSGLAKGSDIVIGDSDFKYVNIVKRKLKVSSAKDNKILVQSSQIIIIAIKPQDFESLAKEIAGEFKDKQIVISIMAGMPLAKIQKFFKFKRVIRSMPNLAAKVQEAFTVYKSGFLMTKKEQAKIESIFESFGKATQVSNEKYLDAATAISGSGPAYVYYFMEALIESAKKLGFKKDVAKEMVEQTFFGALQAQKSSGESAKSLRKKVTSKKGTTDAAIKSFERSKLKKAIHLGVNSAYKRAKELSK